MQGCESVSIQSMVRTEKAMVFHEESVKPAEEPISRDKKALAAHILSVYVPLR